jgi:hypothetical protein
LFDIVFHVVFIFHTTSNLFNGLFVHIHTFQDIIAHHAGDHTHVYQTVSHPSDHNNHPHIHKLLPLYHLIHVESVICHHHPHVQLYHHVFQYVLNHPHHESIRPHAESVIHHDTFIAPFTSNFWLGFAVQIHILLHVSVSVHVTNELQFHFGT